MRKCLKQRSTVMVVIPTINRPKMCGRAVQSVLRQKYSHWVLYIAKNGGDVNWKDYIPHLPRLPRSKVEIVTLPEDGLGYALNETLNKRVNYFDYFAVLEDDDVWHPDFLKQMVRKAQRTKADIVHCRQRQMPYKLQFDGHEIDYKEIRKENFINMPMQLFRSSVFDLVGGFAPNAGTCTDWDMTLRCIQAGARHAFVDDVLVTHYWHDTNMCLLSPSGDYVKRRLAMGVYD